MVIRNAFTIDLEEWFHGLTSTNPQVERWPTFESRVVAATERLLALLARHKVQATFFTLGHVADHHPALIEQIADAGHEIALHGYFHRFVHKLSPDDFAREIERTLEVLQPLVGTPPIGHRAPYFSIRSTMGWAFDILQRFGIRYDSSLFPMRALLYGDADAPRQPHRRPQGLWEYPLYPEDGAADAAGRGRFLLSGAAVLASTTRLPTAHPAGTAHHLLPAPLGVGHRPALPACHAARTTDSLPWARTLGGQAGAVVC